MNARIQKLLDYYQNHNFPREEQIEFDPADEDLPEPIRIAKRITDFTLAQKIHLHKAAELIGQQFYIISGVPTNIFPRYGHQAFSRTAAKYYCKPQENLCTFEWQHSNPDLGQVVRLGLIGLIRQIDASRVAHVGEKQHLDYLTGLETFAEGVRFRTEQYRAYCVAESEKTEDPARKQALRRIAANVEQVPWYPARSFEEAIQSVYICWHFLSDSIGRPDQYLYPLYHHDMEAGLLTREHAKELIQEFFITINRFTPLESSNNDKGGESHFTVGGYTIDHEDGFNDLSELIVEAMMEMPLVRPQVTLRWTKKTPFAVLKKMLDYERKDPYKRVAFANDEPRIQSMMDIMGLPWEVAYDYIVVGCNEPAFQGGISLGGETTNLLHSLTRLFTERRTELLECKNYEEFYTLFTKCLYLDLETLLQYNIRFNALRSGDCNIMSSLFLHGCIERAESATRGGASLARAGWNFMGGTNLIDSLCVIRQFVFDEKRISMAQLLDTLDKNWEGNEILRQQILHEAKFFGNNDDFSNSIAQELNHTLYNFAIGRREHFGNQIMLGNLTGYNPHFAWFGAQTGATPDGRLAGAPLTFGNGPIMGHDRDGVSSMLLAVAKMDPTGIMSGNTILNLTMQRQTVEDEESFDKFAHLIETYFKLGGLHIQLNYISREELLKAKQTPDDYKSLRVRVSGFSAYFTKLREELQDHVIDRTTGKI